jgi:hypothetical protein
LSKQQRTSTHKQPAPEDATSPVLLPPAPLPAFPYAPTATPEVEKQSIKQSVTPVSSPAPTRKKGSERPNVRTILPIAILFSLCL